MRIDFVDCVAEGFARESHTTAFISEWKFPFHKTTNDVEIEFSSSEPIKLFCISHEIRTALQPLNWWKNRLKNRIGLLTGNLPSAPKCICRIFKSSSFASICHAHTHSAASSFTTRYTYFDDCGDVIVEITFSNGSQMIRSDGCIMLMHDKITTQHQ